MNPEPPLIEAIIAPVKHLWCNLNPLGRLLFFIPGLVLYVLLLIVTGLFLPILLLSESNAAAWFAEKCNALFGRKSKPTI
jgi:hypothetical protein